MRGMAVDSARPSMTGAVDRWPAIARRIVWGGVVLDALMFVVGVASYSATAPYQAQYGGYVGTFLFPIGLLVQVGFGAFIAVRRPRPPGGRPPPGAPTP